MIEILYASLMLYHYNNKMALIYFLSSLVCHEHQFKDKYLFYRFHDDDQGIGTVPTSGEKKECDDELQGTITMLGKIGPDAVMRMILRKV